MKKIKELQERKKLNEGRNFGIGFSILKKIGSKFETYLPFTACRDYLNDFIFVEEVKKEIGNAHGYTHKLLNCFNRKRCFYMGVNTLNINSGGAWTQKEEAKQILISNYLNLQTFLNNFEEILGLKNKTTIELDEDTLIFKVPIYWSKSTPLISVYTLLIRCFFNIPENFIINVENLKNHIPLIQGDKYFVASCVKFFEKLNILKFDKIDYKKFNVFDTNVYSVHNFGIVGYLNKN